MYNSNDRTQSALMLLKEFFCILAFHILLAGFPEPTVAWWQNKVLIDNSTHVTQGKAKKITNDINIGPLTRKLVQSPFTCKAENNPLIPPMEKTIQIKIHSKLFRLPCAYFLF